MKKVHETSLHVAAFRSILSPPTRTHIMNNQPFYRAFPLFCNAIADALIARNSETLTPKDIPSLKTCVILWTPDSEANHLALKELETWCKGWTRRNNEEQASPLKLATSVTTINA